jgi:hypothetical protein
MSLDYKKIQSRYIDARMNTIIVCCSSNIEPKEIFLPVASNTLRALAFAISSGFGIAVGCTSDIGDSEKRV